jgi:hypothetical protein
MSVVIDTNGFCESETQVDETQIELNIVDDTQTEPVEVAEPVLEEPAPAAAVVYEEEDDNADFRSRIWNAEMRCRGKEAIVEDLKEQLKFAKSDYDDAVSALRKLATDGNKPMPLFNHAKKVEAEVETVETVADPTQDESWRAKPLLSIFQMGVIKGLGQKKLESLTDLYPTFGHFQDLRISASLEGKPLKEVLPEGFGQKITDQIEEVFLNAISNPLKSVADDLDELAEPDWQDDETIVLEDL